MWLSDPEDRYAARIALILALLALVFALGGCASTQAPVYKQARLPQLTPECVTMTQPRPKLKRKAYSARAAARAYARLAAAYDTEALRADTCREYVQDVWRTVGADVQARQP